MAKKDFNVSSKISDKFNNIIASTQENIGGDTYHPVPLSKIVITENPRRLSLTLADVQNGVDQNDPLLKEKENELIALQSLAKSIKEKGIMHPVHVYKEKDKFNLILGQRRTLASVIAKKQTIYSKIWTNKPSELDLKTFQWIENFHREGLSTWETLQSVEALAKTFTESADKKITVTELANVLSCSKSQAGKYHALINAHEDIRNALQSKSINNITKAYELNKIDDPYKRSELIRQVTENNISKEKLLELTTSVNSTINNTSKTSASKKGRQVSKVKLGATENSCIVREIIESITNKKKYSCFKEQLKEIRWDDLKQVSQIFSDLIRLMEKTQSE